VEQQAIGFVGGYNKYKILQFGDFFAVELLQFVNYYYNNPPTPVKTTFQKKGNVIIYQNGLR
jgi:hypothetical protein